MSAVVTKGGQQHSGGMASSDDERALQGLKMPSKEARLAHLAARGYSKLEGVMHGGLREPSTLAYMLHGRNDAPNKVRMQRTDGWKAVFAV